MLPISSAGSLAPGQCDGPTAQSTEATLPSNALVLAEIF